MADTTLAWFWTPAWQAGEREASLDIAEGRVEGHQTDESLLESLDE